MPTSKERKCNVALSKGDITLYAGAKVQNALKEVTEDMAFYKGVRLSEVMQAVYDQGQKDGRKEIIDKIEAIKKGVNYLAPGRPRKIKKKAAKRGRPASL